MMTMRLPPMIFGRLPPMAIQAFERANQRLAKEQSARASGGDATRRRRLRVMDLRLALKPEPESRAQRLARFERKLAVAR